MKYLKHPVDDKGWTEWIEPILKGYKLACCDCGLVHNMNFRIRKKYLQFQAQRNERATSAKRRKK